MAKFLDKDPFIYEQERSAFVNQLRQFHASKGSPFYRLPTIAGKEFDVYLLYNKVISLGGLTKVTDQGKWESLQEYFGIPATCGHAAFALRQFYVKYLESYERIHHQGEDAEEVLRSRPATPSSQPQKRNIDTRKGPEIPEQLRVNAGLSTQKPRLSDYDKIMLSLQSGLPNEVDFAINVCTLLSNEGRHVLHLERAIRLIDLLLAHCGVFYEGPGGFRCLYSEDWKPTTKRDFVSFWYDTVMENDIREIIGPDTLRTKDQCKRKDAEQFTLRKFGLNDVEGQRILQVAVILRNLSFEDHNKRVMAAHRIFYRFLLLCIHNSCSALRQIGMDTLSNIAEEFILDPIDYRSTQLMFHTIDKAMKNQDKFIILRAMEVVERLSQVDSNVDIIRQCMEERVYRSIIRLLTVHDVQLLLGALEVLLALSERGHVFCTRIACLENSVDVLVCLVTLDAQSLGAEAFVGIKIVDHAPDGIHHPIVSMARNQPASQATPPPPPTAAAAATPPPRPVQHQSTPTPPPAPTQTVNRDLENEKFTCQWLHAFYEADSEGAVSRLDLYSDYLAACSKASRVNMVTSTNFASCIKVVFTGAESQRVDTENGPQVCITGIRKRVLPLPFNWQLYQNLPKSSANYQPQQGGAQSNLASSIMQRMAQRLSPSGSTSSNTIQQRLFPPGMSSPGGGIMYRPGMMSCASGANTASSSQLQQLILGHGLRQQSPSAKGSPVNQIASAVPHGNTANQQQQQAVQASSSVPQTHPPKSVPSDCPKSAAQSTQQRLNPADDSDMLSPQGSLVNHAGIPSAFLQNPLPQHSQAIANNDPSKSPGRSPASPGRAPPPYRPRSPAGSGSQSTTSSSCVPPVVPASPSTCSTIQLPKPKEFNNEVLQEGEVRIEKIPNIHAQLPLDTNQVPITFPQEGTENFPANSIPLLQTKTSSDSTAERYDANKSLLQGSSEEVNVEANATQTGALPVSTVSKQQLRNPKEIESNKIQISAQGVQTNLHGVGQTHGSIVMPEQQMPQNIQMQLSAAPVGLQQLIQPQGGQPSGQAVLNVNSQGVVPTSGLKAHPNVQIIPQGVLSSSQGIQISTIPVQPNSLPMQTNFQIKQSDGKAMTQILPKTTAVAPQAQQIIVGGSSGSANGASQMYSAYAVVQNVQRSVPTVLGQVTGQVSQGSQPASSVSGTYVPIQPKLPAQVQQQQQQNTVVHCAQQQQQPQAFQQTQQQFILTSIHTTMPHQSFAVTTISNTQQQQQQQQTLALGVAAPVASPQTVQSTVNVCSQNQSIGTVTVNRVQAQGQQLTTTHIDSPLIKQLLQSASPVHPPNANPSPQQQLINSNAQSAVQWVVPQNPNVGVVSGLGNAVHGIVNIQGSLTQQGITQAYAVNQALPQGCHLSNQQPAVHFIPPLCSSPSPVQSPVLSYSSSSSPSSTSKSYPLSPSPNPQHKSEKKSKSKSHKSKKSSKKKKSKSSCRSPITCSKAVHGKDDSKKAEKEASIHLVKKTTHSEVISNQDETVDDSSLNQGTGNNSEKDSEPKTEQPVNRIEEKSDQPGTPKPTCNGSATKENEEISETNGIQKLKSKLEEASLKQSLLNGYGNGDELKHRDALIHRAELLLESSGKDLEKVLKSPKRRRKSEEFGLNDRTCRLNMDQVAERDSVEKQCTNHIVNGDIQTEYENRPDNKDENGTAINAKGNFDGQSNEHEIKADNYSSGECDKRQTVSFTQTDKEEPMDQSEPGRTTKSKSPSDILLNERTGYMHDVSGAVIPLANPGDTKPRSPVAFCRDIRENLPTDTPTSGRGAPNSEGNLNNNSNPGLLDSSSCRGGAETSTASEDCKESVVGASIPKTSQISFAIGASSQSSLSVNTNSVTCVVASMKNSTSDPCTQTSQEPVQKLKPQVSTSESSASIPNSSSNQQSATSTTKSHERTSSETKSEKSSNSKSSSKKTSGKRSRHSSESSSSKKRRRSSSSGSSHHRKSSSSSSGDKSKHHHHHHHHQQQSQQATRQKQQQLPPQPPEVEICLCDWRGCKRNFKTRKALHVHASTAHILVSTYRGLCEWANCDNIQRQRWSCVSHVLEKHCSEQALRAAAEKRQQAPTPSTSTALSEALPSPILYNAHTAYHAIRRSLHNPTLKDLLGESEGPVTKSIRITAALVLKNLAAHSAEARSSLRKHEIHLARLAISNLEASSTLAKCVGELNDSRHLECDSDDDSESS